MSRELTFDHNIFDNDSSSVLDDLYVNGSISFAKKPADMTSLYLPVSSKFDTDEIVPHEPDSPIYVGTLSEWKNISFSMLTRSYSSANLDDALAGSIQNNRRGVEDQLADSVGLTSHIMFSRPLYDWDPNRGKEIITDLDAPETRNFLSRYNGPYLCTYLNSAETFRFFIAEDAEEVAFLHSYPWEVDGGNLDLEIAGLKKLPIKRMLETMVELEQAAIDSLTRAIDIEASAEAELTK